MNVYNGKKEKGEKEKRLNNLLGKDSIKCREYKCELLTGFTRPFMINTVF